MEAREPAEDVRRRVFVTARAGGPVLGLGDRDVAHAVEDAFDADAPFGAGERRARASVHAVPERDVLSRVRAVGAETRPLVRSGEGPGSRRR